MVTFAEWIKLGPSASRVLRFKDMGKTFEKCLPVTRDSFVARNARARNRSSPVVALLSNVPCRSSLLPLNGSDAVSRFLGQLPCCVCHVRTLSAIRRPSSLWNHSTDCFAYREGTVASEDDRNKRQKMQVITSCNFMKVSFG